MLTKDLVYWINEREYMRLAKEDLLGDHHIEGPPWSLDPLMSAIRYCNIRREDDKVTRWIAKNWRNPNYDSPHLVLAMAAARLVNTPETLDAIRFPDEDFPVWKERAKQMIRMLQEEGKKTWSSAYIVSTCGRKMSKEDYVFDHVLPQVQMMFTGSHPDAIDCSLDLAHRQLMAVDGLGSFLAAQVVADLKNTPGHALGRAPDWWTWCAPGPGSLRGLSYFFDRKISPPVFTPFIDAAYAEVMDKVHPYVGRLNMQDFQNCMCEFSKYMKAKNGDGWPRNRYPSASR